MNYTSKSKPSQEKPWRKYLPEGALDAEIPHRTAYRYLLDSNADRRGLTALNFYRRKITYGELDRMIVSCSDALWRLGVREGDTVSFISIATPECIACVYGVNRIGATSVMIDPRMDVRTISKMVHDSGSKVLFVLDASFEKVSPILDGLGQDHVVVPRVPISLPVHLRMLYGLKNPIRIDYSYTVIRWEDFISRGTTSVEAPYVGDRVMAITFTGGTTGFPKGVMITNDSMNAVAVNFRDWGIEYEIGQRFLGIIPIFSSYGMVCGLHMPLSMGLELIPISKFVPEEFGKLVKRYRPNHMISTPAFYEMLMNSREVRNMDLSFLMTLGSGGDTMNTGLEDRLEAFMHDHGIRYPLAQGYGMSELSAAATFCANDVHKRGSVGIPSPTTTVGIFDPDSGEELDYNEVGEICVTGPSMMKGYWNNPEETANIMRVHQDGRTWIHSGDLGYMDEDGFLFVKGRIKRMITRFDGHKVFPVNLESIIMSNPAIRNCAVIGVDDRGHSQGQYPMALVEVAEGFEPLTVCKMIYLQCQRDAEERGRPMAVLHVPAIPLTGMGKNDYRSLEREYRGYDYTSFEVS